MIPVKLKILKLFIKELSNIAEGTGGSLEDNEGWESDEEEDYSDWEDVSDGGSGIEIEAQDKLLRGIKTKVGSVMTYAKTRIS